MCVCLFVWFNYSFDFVSFSSRMVHMNIVTMPLLYHSNIYGDKMQVFCSKYCVSLDIILVNAKYILYKSLRSVGIQLVQTRCILDFMQHTFIAWLTLVFQRYYAMG